MSSARASGCTRRHAFLQQLGHLHRLERDLQLAGLDQRQIEHLVDQAQQVACAAQDLADMFALLLGERVLRVGDQQLPETEDRVHRRAQLVRHAREELRLRPVGTLGLVLGVGQRQLGGLARADVDAERVVVAPTRWPGRR